MADRRIAYTVTLGELAGVPGTPYSYWTPESLRALFERYPPLDRDVAGRPAAAKLADAKEGLGTCDDARFTRRWWEVGQGQVAPTRDETRQGMGWVPFAKGGHRYYSDFDQLVYWADDGYAIRHFPKASIRNEGFYFSAGLTFPLIVRSSYVAFSLLPPGMIFSTSALMVRPREATNNLALLGVLSSTLIAYLFTMICPLSHNTRVGEVARLPVAPYALGNETLARVAREAYDIEREWSTGDETSTQFVRPWLLQITDTANKNWDEATTKPTTGHPLARDFAWSEWESAKAIRALAPTGEFTLFSLAQACVERERLLRQRIEEIQRQIDDEVYRLYGISDEDRALIEAEMGRHPDVVAEEATEAAEPGEEEEPAPKGLMPAEEHIRRLVHYLAHQALRVDSDGIIPLFDSYTPDGHLERGLAYRVREQLRDLFGEEALPRLEQELGMALGKPLDDWLATDFFGYHVGLYRLRPIIWQVASKPRGPATYGCFVYWHRLDDDTLRKIQEVYLRPVLEGAKREAGQAAARLTERRLARAPLRELREAERAYQRAEDLRQELQCLSEKIRRLLQPQRLQVTSRSAWVTEKVNEIMARGYRPVRDYGVRVNIEPLKQAGIVPVAAERVKG